MNINSTLDFVFPRAVEGHFSHPLGREWMNMTDHVTPLLAELIGEPNIFLKITPTDAIMLGRVF